MKHLNYMKNNFILIPKYMNFNNDNNKINVHLINKIAKKYF